MAANIEPSLFLAQREENMAHLCDRYFAKHGHYPTVAVISGVQRITVEFAPGYVSIRTSSPYQAQVYLTRSAFFALMRKLLPLAKAVSRDPAEDHDVPSAMREAYFQEVALLEAKRQLKRSQSGTQEDVDRRAKQQRRFLKARARAASEDGQAQT